MNKNELASPRYSLVISVKNLNWLDFLKFKLHFPRWVTLVNLNFNGSLILRQCFIISHSKDTNFLARQILWFLLLHSRPLIQDIFLYSPTVNNEEQGWALFSLAKRVKSPLNLSFVPYLFCLLESNQLSTYGCTISTSYHDKIFHSV